MKAAMQINSFLWNGPAELRGLQHSSKLFPNASVFLQPLCKYHPGERASVL